MGWWSLLGGAGQGAVIGSGVSAAANMMTAERSMQHSQRMDSTKWQRNVADMKAAGINPILAAQTGANNTAQGSAAQIPDLAATALGAAKIKAEIGVLKSQKKANEGAANKSNADSKWGGILSPGRITDYIFGNNQPNWMNQETNSAKDAAAKRLKSRSPSTRS